MLQNCYIIPTKLPLSLLRGNLVFQNTWVHDLTRPIFVGGGGTGGGSSYRKDFNIRGFLDSNLARGLIFGNFWDIFNCIAFYDETAHFVEGVSTILQLLLAFLTLVFCVVLFSLLWDSVTGKSLNSS